MAAPDKIFVHTGKLGFLCASKINITGNDTEYIRKDALIEWLKQKRFDLTDKPDDSAYQKVIDKLNEM